MIEKINEMFAIISVDPKDNTEGIMAIRTPDGMMRPLIGADMARLKSLYPIAKKISDAAGQSFRVLKFSDRKDITEECQKTIEKKDRAMYPKNTIVLSHFSPVPVTIDLTTKYAQGDAREQRMKPRGLWLSDETDHGWSKWCKDENFRIDKLKYELPVTIDLSKMAVIKNRKSLELFTAAFKANPFPELELPHEMYMHLDWKAIAKEYKGLLITPYIWECRHDFTWYYPWDCASACIWDLTAVVEIGKLRDTEEKQNERLQSRLLPKKKK